MTRIMNRMDNIRLLQDLSYRRRKLAWRAGGVAAAIALSSCISTGVAYADELVVDTADQQAQAALVQDAQGVTEDQQVTDAVVDVSNEDATVPEASDEEREVTEADQAEATSEDSASSEVSSTDNSKTAVSTTATSTTAADKGTLAKDSEVKDASGQTIEAFDLRHAALDSDGTLTSVWVYSDGDTQSTISGGTSYVTTVKLQNPWGTCWAFASTAASETSLLTELDKADDGVLNGSINSTLAAEWLANDMADDGELNGSLDYGTLSQRMGLLTEYASDLSERHLAWFAFSDVAADSIYPDQADEGRHLVNGSKEAIYIYESGGTPWLSMTVYSNGNGPVNEATAPYTSDEHYYQVRTPEWDEQLGDLVPAYFTSYEEALKYSQETWTEEFIQQFLEEHGWTSINRAALVPTLSKKGTWGLSDDQAYQVVAELSNSNVLDQNLNVHGLTAQEALLMKQELLEGHAISIAYHADQTKPGETLAGNTYINTTTWAQYTYDGADPDHSVTIIGYDDNYDASNFTHYIYKTDAKGNVLKDEDGNPVIDWDKTALTTPAGNGAWIVKNSWGALDSTVAAYQNDWGIDGTGYFYLSYYDKSICNMETYEFDVSEEAQDRFGYLAYQHDLAKSSQYNVYTSEEVSKICNVFDGPESGEGTISIRDLGFATGAAGDTAYVELYVMDDDADVEEVIKAGNPVATASQTFENAGFHRIHLDSSVIVMPNQKFAVVQTTKTASGAYEYLALYFYNEAFTTAFNAVTAPIGQTLLSYYSNAVVNRGESLILKDDSWQDWVDVAVLLDKEGAVKEQAEDRVQLYQRYAAMYQAATDPELKVKLLQVMENAQNFTINTAFAFDNWCIKVYADDTGIDLELVEGDGVDQTSENTKALNDTCADIVKSLYDEGVLPSNVKEFTNGAIKAAVEAEDGLIAELKAVKADENDVSAGEKGLIALAVQSVTSSDGMSEVLQYFDIEFLLKNKNTGEVLGAITQTSAPISFAIQLDSDLLAQLEGKDIYLVRIHDGISTFIDAVIENGVLKFSSDLFSTYALAAVSELAPPPEPEPQAEAQTQTASYTEGTASPKTGDDSAAVVGFAGALAALSSAVMLRLRRRRA